MTTQDELPERYDTSLSLIDGEMTRRYGDRYVEYRRQYAQTGKFQYEPEFPLYLMLEQTYRCNLRCPSCIQGFPGRKSRFNTNCVVMPRSVFDRVILEGERYRCPSIAFMVNDEPLLVKDLPERVAFAKKHGFMDLFVTTNGNLLYPDVMERLLEAGITRILFSLDAAIPETYKKVRPDGDFSVTMSNLEALLEYKKAKGLILPAVRVSFVATKLNIHELKLFIETFAKRVDYLEIQPFSVYYDANADLIPPNAERIKDFRCTDPWRKLIIRPNGDVLPCCAFYGYEIVLGNSLHTSLKDIFQSPQYQQLRQDSKKSTYRLSPCLACFNSFYEVKEGFSQTTDI
jgi:radical SAM protein with 4Fe4S-binding SPASM domain